MNNITLPPRIQLRTEDNRSGSYPMVLRTGDDRTGVKASLFDDTDTVVFATDVEIALPSGLRAGSKHLRNQTSSFDTVDGNVRKGVGDQLVHFTSSNVFTPFNEERHVEQTLHASTDGYYLTGSRVEDVGFGFTSPPKSKTSIQIDMSPSEDTILQLSSAQGTDPDTEGVGSWPMAYYNFESKRWERVGLGYALVDDNTDFSNYDVQMLGFSPSSRDGSDVILNPSQSCVPLDQFGFPVHAKFHATSSQLFHMTSSINHPFLLEKIVYEFTASFTGSTKFLPQSEGCYNTFFMLNQRGPASEALIFPESPAFTNGIPTLTATLPQNIQLSQGGPQVDVDTSRDIVTFMQVSSFSTTLNTDSADFEKFAKRELTLYGDSIDASWSGTFTMSGTAKTPATQQFLTYFNDPGLEETAVSYRYGGRSNNGRPSGRDLVNAIVGNTAENVLDSGFGEKVVVADQLSGTSPYLLFPEDKLIFGWQVGWVADMDATAGTDDKGRLRLFTGPGRITLYGSLVRENTEFHDTLNQLLTSDAVHEPIYEHVLDQYDVEPRSSFSGSYLGEYVTGSISGSSRGVVASTVVGSGAFEDITALAVDHEMSIGRVLGFSRTCKLTSENERFHDTNLPSARDIAVLNGSEIFGWSENRGVLIVGHTNDFQANADATWNRAFPFEPRYSTAVRQLDASKFFEVTEAGKDPKVVLFLFARTVAATRKFVVDRAGNYVLGEDFLLAYYGIGPNTLYTGSSHYGEDATYLYGSKPRAFKYGVLNALPQYSVAHFRRNHYGQFRDMLEQRQDAKFYDVVGIARDGSQVAPGVRRSPIQIGFSGSDGDNPYGTMSSNMSIEATSSVPYFDDVVRNREEPLVVVE